MIRKRTFQNKKKADVYHEQRFYPSGSYSWSVPEGCESVDVFLVGGGGGAKDTMPGGGGYTKTYKQSTSGYRDGAAISVTPGQSISIVVGAGGEGSNADYATGGGYSQFKSSSYRANGGTAGSGVGSSSEGGSGGSGAGAWYGYPGTDGSDGTGSGFTPGKGQGHTTRDFGESTGKRNAGGGSNNRAYQPSGGESDYSEGSGGTSYSDEKLAYTTGGGGYGGGGSGATYPYYVGDGGDGTVLIRYYSY